MRQLPNWLWAALVLALVGVVVWGWAFDFSTGGGQTSAPGTWPRYPVVVSSPHVVVRPHGIDSRGLPRIVSPTRLGLMVSGSGHCPPLPDELVVLSPHTIRIHFAAPTCSLLDYALTPMLVAIDPTDVDVKRPITLRLFLANSKKPEVLTMTPVN